MNFYKEPVYGPKRQELNWLNGCIIAHDNFCGCNTPADHLLWVLATKSGYSVVKNQQKCLTTGTEETTGEKDDFGLEEGELELLFAEDTDKEDTG